MVQRLMQLHNTTGILQDQYGSLPVTVSEENMISLMMM